MAEHGWTRRATPRICERLLGFSVPRDDRVLVVSYEGTHVVQLGESITVEHDHQYREHELYDSETGIARHQGLEYSIVGLHGGAPLRGSPQGETLVLDEDAQTLTVRGLPGSSFELRYENFSGDWAAATFSPDGRWIVLGCPYDFDFVLLERVTISAD